MTHTAAILWYLFLVGIIFASYYASLYTIKKFDRKWKTITEAEQEEVDKQEHLNQ